MHVFYHTINGASNRRVHAERLRSGGLFDTVSPFSGRGRLHHADIATADKLSPNYVQGNDPTLWPVVV